MFNGISNHALDDKEFDTSILYFYPIQSSSSIIMSKDEPIDGPTEEYRKETVKKLEREKEVDTIGRDTSNESVA